MFNTFPIEIIETILLYVNIKDILSVFYAYNIHYTILSDYFWKRVSLREGFSLFNKTQEWYECFLSGTNKRLGNYIKVKQIPSGTLEHVYLKTLVIRDINKSVDKASFSVYFLDEENSFNLVQVLMGKSIQFRENFIINQEKDNIVMYKYDNDSYSFKYYKLFSESIENIFGVSDKYCVAVRPKQNYFSLHIFSSDTVETICIPPDVKFLFQKILHEEEIVISVLTFNDGYKIKIYDINTSTWAVDLVCFGSTGISNDPNIWVGSKFLGYCDISYRIRGIYFGPFKLWNKKGELLFQTDIEPSKKPYLRCFFREEHVLLTTSDDTLSVFNSKGNTIATLCTKLTFLDIKLSSEYLLFLLLEGNDCVEVYDWRMSSCLYTIKLEYKHLKALCSEWLFCPTNFKSFEVIKFF